MAKGQVTDVKGHVSNRTERGVDRVTNTEEKEMEDAEAKHTRGQRRDGTECRRQRGPKR